MKSKSIGGHQKTVGATDTWFTPPHIIKALGEFDLDPCSHINRPFDTARMHYTIEDDGLKLPWFNRCYVNPPYNRYLITAFLKKMSEHANGIALVFARTDRKDFHDYIFSSCDSILFLKGRLTFLDINGTKAPANGGAPSMLVSYGQDNVDALHESGLAGKHVFLNSVPMIVVGVSPSWKSVVNISLSRMNGSGDNQEITVACMGGSGFKIDVGLNYRINAYKASKIYLKYATDDLESISQSYLRNVVRGAMQDISGTITVDSLLNNVPGFEKDVLGKLNAKLVPEGFTIDLFNVISQPRPIDKDLATSINQKIKAKQDAERVKMELQSSIANAEKDIAKARGDSSARVISAAGEAEAIRRLQVSLSADYIQYIKATRWNGVLPSVISGSGGGLFMTLPDNK